LEGDGTVTEMWSAGTADYGRDLCSRWLVPFLKTPEEASNNPDLATWSIDNLPESGPGGWFEADPREIYDLDGRLVYRDFTMALEDGSELRVRTSPARALAPDVVSLAATPPLRIGERLEQARAFANDAKLEEVAQASLVCYAYPKLGLLCRERDGDRFIVDLGDFSLLSAEPMVLESPELLGVSPPSGVATSITEEIGAELGVLTPVGLPEGGDLESEVAEGGGLENMVAGQEAASHEHTLPGLILCPQESPVYCAVAVAQMVLAHFGIKATQTEISASMGTGPKGSTNEQQMKAYKELSKGDLDPQLDMSASFSDPQFEISGGRPSKSGVPGHARLCGGYKVVPTANGVDTKWLYIYDPWPPQQGAIYWEDWRAIPHTNFIYVRPTGVLG
jgi:hypothetical protein